jgi:hypothetical protein
VEATGNLEAIQRKRNKTKKQKTPPASYSKCCSSTKDKRYSAVCRGTRFFSSWELSYSAPTRHFRLKSMGIQKRKKKEKKKIQAEIIEERIHPNRYKRRQNIQAWRKRKRITPHVIGTFYGLTLSINVAWSKTQQEQEQEPRAHQSSPQLLQPERLHSQQACPPWSRLLPAHRHRRMSRE